MSLKLTKHHFAWTSVKNMSAWDLPCLLGGYNKNNPIFGWITQGTSFLVPGVFTIDKSLV